MRDDLTATVRVHSLGIDVHINGAEQTATLVRDVPNWPLEVERYPLGEFIARLRARPADA